MVKIKAAEAKMPLLFPLVWVKIQKHYILHLPKMKLDGILHWPSLPGKQPHLKFETQVFCYKFVSKPKQRTENVDDITKGYLLKVERSRRS